MTGLLIGLTGCLILTGVVMALLDRAHAAPERARRRFRQRLPMRTPEAEQRRVYVLNVVISNALLYGAATLGYRWLFVDGAIGPWRAIGHAAVVLLVYDGLYYGMHRVMHHRWIMRRIHALHHQVRAPSARDSLYVHPVETAAGVGLLLFSTWLVGPVHVPTFLVAFGVFSVLNVVVHAGFAFERGPLRLLNPWARRHHGHHGVDMNGNYASLTPVWDKVFGTTVPPERR